MKRSLSALLTGVILLCAVIGCPLRAFSSAAEENAENPDTDTAAVSSSDAAYFDRVAVIPLDVTVPEFYQQVINIAGMYIFSTPDGTVYKRMYGALDGVYGWYIPVGPENTVPADAQPIDPVDDIAMYNAAVQQYKEENAAVNYVGILPPEDGTYNLEQLFGQPVRNLVGYAIAGTGGLCLLILLGFAVRSVRRKRTRSLAIYK